MKGAPSITRKLFISVLLVVFLFVANLLALYFSSRKFLSRVSALHESQLLSDRATQLRQLSTAAIDTLSAAKPDPQGAETSKGIFLGIRDTAKEKFKEAHALAGEDTEQLAHLARADEIFRQLEATADNLFASLRVDFAERRPLKPATNRSVETQGQFLVATQYGLELLEELGRLRIRGQKRSSEEFESIYRGRYGPLAVTSFVTAIFTLLALTLGSRFARSFQRSVENLDRATAEIRKGNLGHQAPILNNDELGRLTRAFNSMSAALKDSTVSREYMESIIESMPDPVVVVNSQGRIASSNRAALKILNPPLGNLTGRSIGSFLDDAHGAVERELKDLSESENEVDPPTVRDSGRIWTTQSGRRIPVAISASVIRGSPGSREGVVCVIKDISEQREAERQIQEQNLALTAANRELEAFSYSVSHDLRAPLRSMDGFSKYLIEQPSEGLGERGKDYLRRIRESAQRMAQLIDDILNLSRLGRTELKKQDVDLSRLAESVLDNLKKAEPSRAVELVVTPGVHAFGDPNLLRVVLENLLGNSWKYTSAHRRARIEFGTRNAQGAREFYVSDDGAGFDMAYADKLFGAFQRLHGTSQFPGTGIGLALVKRIISRHGGNVKAVGQVEKGATVSFTLKEGTG